MKNDTRTFFLFFKVFLYLSFLAPCFIYFFVNGGDGHVGLGIMLPATSSIYSVGNEPRLNQLAMFKQLAQSRTHLKKGAVEKEKKKKRRKRKKEKLKKLASKPICNACVSKEVAHRTEGKFLECIRGEDVCREIEILDEAHLVML